VPHEHTEHIPHLISKLNNIAGHIPDIINWVVRALNADWLTAMVYQTVYHGYDKTCIFYCSNYVGNQFIIAIRHIRGFVVFGQYTMAKGFIQALRIAYKNNP
jgi:hypothetical protein